MHEETYKSTLVLLEAFGNLKQRVARWALKYLSTKKKKEMSGVIENIYAQALAKVNHDNTIMDGT